MIWATVSSWSFFCWLYRVFPSLAAKNIINLISVLTILSNITGKNYGLTPNHTGKDWVGNLDFYSASLPPPTRMVSEKITQRVSLLSPLNKYVVVVQSLSHFQLCNPMDCSTPGFPVLHYLPEFAQTHVHWVGDAIQPSHPLSPLSPPYEILPMDTIWTPRTYNHFHPAGKKCLLPPFWSRVRGSVVKNKNFYHQTVVTRPFHISGGLVRSWKPHSYPAIMRSSFPTCLSPEAEWGTWTSIPICQ